MNVRKYNVEKQVQEEKNKLLGDRKTKLFLRQKNQNFNINLTK